MEDEFDAIVFEDENGNEITLDLLDMFEYKDRKFVILADHYDEDESDGNAHEHHGCDVCGCGCEDSCEDAGIYIMELKEDAEGETFVDIDDTALLDEVVKYFESRLEPIEE